jgi:hypothetical protein
MQFCDDNFKSAKDPSQTTAATELSSANLVPPDHACHRSILRYQEWMSGPSLCFCACKGHLARHLPSVGRKAQRTIRLRAFRARERSATNTIWSVFIDSVEEGLPDDRLGIHVNADDDINGTDGEED